jgi:hypothetical protein
MPLFFGVGSFDSLGIHRSKPRPPLCLSECEPSVISDELAATAERQERRQEEHTFKADATRLLWQADSFIGTAVERNAGVWLWCMNQGGSISVGFGASKPLWLCIGSERRSPSVSCASRVDCAVQSGAGLL